MFGRTAREALRIAQEAKDRSDQASFRIERHEAVCMERWKEAKASFETVEKGIDRTERSIEKTNQSLAKLFWCILGIFVSIAGASVLLIGEHVLNGGGGLK